MKEIEENDDIISLEDEEGNLVDFEFVTTILLNQKEYFVLMPIDKDDTQEKSGDEIENVLILRVDKDDKNEECLISIEEEEEKTVFDKFKEMMQEEYDFEE